MKTFAVALVALVGTATARSTPAGHAQHEARHVLPQHPWEKAAPAKADLYVPVHVGLTQSNLEKGADMLADVAHPESPNFGKQLSAEEVARLFAPSQSRVDAVYKWLEDSLSTRKIVLSASRQWFQFNATVAELQDLLHTEYHEYQHASNSKMALGCDKYHLPRHIREHVDFITPAVKTLELRKRSTLAKRSSHSGPKVTKFPSFGPETSGGSGAGCDYAITPSCVRALYNITDATPVNKNNSMAVYETYDLFYNQTDLNLFFSTFNSSIPQGTHPVYDKVDGAPSPIGPEFIEDPEAQVDTMAAYPLIYPNELVEFQVDDKYWETTGAFNNDYFGIFNTFLDALDKSYCNYSAYGVTGDTPGIDATYPDTNPGGYDHPEQCGAYKPTNVISISYGEEEDQLPLNYQRRQCNEWMKLGLQGVSVIVASGDSGVNPMNGGSCERNNTLFSINSPVDCPYITVVGGTYLPVGGTAGKTPEVASNSFPTSGGFSNIFGQPWYQASAVNSYFKNHAPSYPYYNITLNATHNHGIYNRGGRGYPDIAASGQNFAIYFQGASSLVSGTSIAAPLVAGMITRINAERMNAGKKSIGFLNPTLYAHPEIFNDITSGDNPGCGTNGFSAVPGWDPVSGLGTPNYGKLKEVLMGLK